MKSKTGETVKEIVSNRDAGQKLTPMQRTVLFKQGRAHLEQKIRPVSKPSQSPVMIMAKEWKERSLMPIVNLLLPGQSVRKALEQNIQKIFPAVTALEIISRLPATAAQTCQFYNSSDCQDWLKQFANITKDSTQEDCYAACSNCQNFNSGAVDQCSSILWACLQANPTPPGGSSSDNKWIIGVIVGCVALVGVLAVWKCWQGFKKKVDPLLEREGRVQREGGAGMDDPNFQADGNNAGGGGFNLDA